MFLEVTLTGERPMLQHNGRLANPIDAYVRRLKGLTGKRKKTDEDLSAIAQVEARGACWETPDGMLGVPNEAVWRCLYDAAKAYKLGEDIKRALLFENAVMPLLLDGEPVKCDEFLSTWDHIFYKSVKIGRARTMRARPRIPLPWSSTHRFELLTDVIDAESLVPVVDRAGRLVGIGDWRPTYGRFTATVKEVTE